MDREPPAAATAANANGTTQQTRHATAPAAVVRAATEAVRSDLFVPRTICLAPHLRPCLLVFGHRNIVSPDCVDAVLSEARGRAMNASNSNVVSHRSNWRRQSDWLCVRAHAR